MGKVEFLFDKSFSYLDMLTDKRVGGFEDSLISQVNQEPIAMQQKDSNMKILIITLTRDSNPIDNTIN